MPMGPRGYITAGVPPALEEAPSVSELPALHLPEEAGRWSPLLEGLGGSPHSSVPSFCPASAPLPRGARSAAAPTPFPSRAGGRPGRVPAPRGAARGARGQPRVRAGGPGPVLAALEPGPAPLLGDALLAPGPGTHPGAPARGLPRRLLRHLPAATPGGRPLQLPPAPGLQRLRAVPALPAEPLPPAGSPPRSRAAAAAAPASVSASG